MQIPEIAAPPKPGEDDEGWPSVAALLAGCAIRFIDSASVTHRVIEYGDGPPLILVHGVGGHAEAWARNIRSLGANFHVYAIDAIYHGFSSLEPWRADTWIAQAEAVSELVTALGRDWVYYEGESMGAVIGFEFAMRFPHQCRKLILNTGFGAVALDEPTLGVDLAAFANLRALSQQAANTSAASVRRRLEWLVSSPERMTDDMVQIRQAVYRRPGLVDSMVRVMHLDEPTFVPPTYWTAADLASVQQETLVLWSEHNPGQTTVYGKYVAGLLPKGRYHCIDDAGHWPQWEHPAEHDAVVTDFLLGR